MYTHFNIEHYIHFVKTISMRINTKKLPVEERENNVIPLISQWRSGEPHISVSDKRRAGEYASRTATSRGSERERERVPSSWRRFYPGARARAMKVKESALNRARGLSRWDNRLPNPISLRPLFIMPWRASVTSSSTPPPPLAVPLLFLQRWLLTSSGRARRDDVSLPRPFSC